MKEQHIRTGQRGVAYHFLLNFGRTLEEIAATLGKPKTTIASWSARGIPEDKMDFMILKAKEHGVDMSERGLKVMMTRARNVGMKKLKEARRRSNAKAQ